MKRAILALVALVVLAGVASADNTILFYERNVASASYEYCLASDIRVPQTGAISSAVTGATAVTSGTSNLFTGMAVGDVIYFHKQDGTVLTRYIATYTDANNIAVNSNITIPAGTRISWRDMACGTTATSGWVEIGPETKAVIVELNMDTIGSTSIDVVLEGRSSSGGDGAALWTKNYTAAGGAVDELFPVTELGIDAVRLGMKVNTDGVDAVSAFLATR